MRLRFTHYFLIIITVFSFSGCKQKEFETKTFFTMGSFLSITIPVTDAKYTKEAVTFIDAMSKSLTDDEKRVSEAAVGEYTDVSQAFIDLYNSAKKYYVISGGKFDPTAVTVSNFYGFGTDNLTIPANDTIQKAKSVAGLDNIAIENGKIVKKTPLNIEFGAEGKGYIADAAAAFLKSKGVDNFIINAGGDMYVSGSKFSEPFIVGIVDPQNTTRVTTAIKVKSSGIATSGNYERALSTADGKRINHIFTGKTFEPADNYASVSVVAHNAAAADALATLYYLSDIDTISKLCSEYSTPVLVIDNLFAHHKLCGWEALEAK